MSTEIAELDTPVTVAEQMASAAIAVTPTPAPKESPLLDAFDKFIAAATSNEQKWLGRNQQLHSDLARGAIFYRELRDADELEEVYHQKNLDCVPTKEGETPDFSEFVDIVFGFPLSSRSNTQKVTRSTYKRVFEGLHVEWEDNPDKYQHEPHGKLLTFIENKGGVAGFLKNFDPNAKDEDSSGKKKAKRQTRAAIDARKLKAVIAKRFLDEIDTVRDIGAATLKQPVRVGHHQLTAFLGRPDGTSAKILGSSNDPNLIDGLLASVGANAGDGVGPAFAAILAATGTQLFPRVACPENHEDRAAAFRHLAEPSEVPKASGQLMAASDRLLIRGGNEMLLSKSRVSTSTVTLCKLKRPLIDETPSAYLHAGDLTLVKQWMEDGLTGAMRAEPEDRLSPATKAGSNLVYKLHVSNETAQFSKDLHFYKASTESKTQFQTDFKRDEFASDWEFQVPPGFFSEVRAKFTDFWFAGLGQHDQITKEYNDVLRLVVKSDRIEIVFNLRGDAPPSVVFELPEPMAVSIETRESAYRSLDLAPALYNLADALVEGPVTVAGNAHALVIRYANHLGAFEIAIPALVDLKTKLRDGLMFFGFGKPAAP